MKIDEYKKIEEHDAEVDMSSEDGQMLYEIIDDIDGVDNVDYSGHFGPSIYYRVDSDYDNEELHAKIRQTIREYIA